MRVEEGEPGQRGHHIGGRTVERASDVCGERKRVGG